MRIKITRKNAKYYAILAIFIVEITILAFYIKIITPDLTNVDCTEGCLRGCKMKGYELDFSRFDQTFKRCECYCLNENTSCVLPTN